MMLFVNNNINNYPLHYKIRIRCDDRKKLFWNNEQVTINFIQENSSILSNIINSNFYPNIKQINITTSTLSTNNHRKTLNRDNIIIYLEFYLDYPENDLNLYEEFYNFIEMLQDENFTTELESENNIHFYNLQNDNHVLVYWYKFAYDINNTEEDINFNVNEEITKHRWFNKREYSTFILYKK